MGGGGGAGAVGVLLMMSHGHIMVEIMFNDESWRGRGRWVGVVKDTFFFLLWLDPPPPPPLHDHPQYTVLITERTSKAYLI